MRVQVISGGQTGVDRAALDAALACNIVIGGYCPKGRLAEDGPIPDKYPLIELPTSDYAPRTRKNIQEADATLVLYSGRIVSPGTKLTVNMCKQKGDGGSWIGVDLKEANDETVDFVRRWLDLGGFLRLNVAGPRESKNPGIYDRAYAFLVKVFQEGE